MTGDLQRRISDWLPSDISDRGEIRDALDGTRWVSELDPATTRRVVDGVNAERSPDTAGIDREASQQTTLMGPTDNRQTQLRDPTGKVVGNPDNVSTWEDTHGNIMYHNTNTGNRGKLTDSEDRA